MSDETKTEMTKRIVEEMQKDHLFRHTLGSAETALHSLDLCRRAVEKSLMGAGADDAERLLAVTAIDAVRVHLEVVVQALKTRKCGCVEKYWECKKHDAQGWGGGCGLCDVAVRGARFAAGPEKTPALRVVRERRLLTPTLGYPTGWPLCANCELPALDGKATCGRVECSR